MLHSLYLVLELVQIASGENPAGFIPNSNNCFANGGRDVPNPVVLVGFVAWLCLGTVQNQVSGSS